MPKLDLVPLLARITQATMLIKMDVPYMPKNFPIDYPNKDMDIIVHPQQYYSVLGEIQAYVEQYPEFERLTVADTEGCGVGARVRLTEKGKLHYQFDLADHFFDLPDWFILEALEMKRNEGYYFVPTVEHEIIFRIVAYVNKPKPWHAEYVREHKKDVNWSDLMNLNLEDAFDEIISKKN